MDAKFQAPKRRRLRATVPLIARGYTVTIHGSDLDGLEAEIAWWDSEISSWTELARCERNELSTFFLAFKAACLAGHLDLEDVVGARWNGQKVVIYTGDGAAASGRRYEVAVFNGGER